MDHDSAVVDDASYSRIYDYFKHLTTVSLISIGGVLGLLRGETPGVSAGAVMVVIALLSLGGFLAMMTMCAISAMAMLRRPRMAKNDRLLLVLQYAATFALMAGLGYFLGAFSKVVI